MNCNLSLSGSAFLKEIVYLDNSSTTKPSPAAVAAVERALCESWGNPSSLHGLGISAELEVSAARAALARALGAEENEIYFTASGTESDNTAILGAARALKKRGRRIVTTAAEHHAVLNTVARLEDDGFEVVRIVPDQSGNISERALLEAVTSDTVLVSIMLVNNETGAIFPVSAAAEAIRRVGAPALLHCDAVQAFGKMAVNVKRLGVDLLTVSGHKLHAPKGVGALYVRRGVHIPALITGGGQEKGLRSGTEAVPAICGFGAAIKELGDPAGHLKLQQELFDYALQRLTRDAGAVVNSPQNGLPYILNVSFEGYRSETMLHFLEARGIYVSSGSACAKGGGSHVLTAMGLPPSRVDSALRISFSRDNTKADIDRLTEAVCEAKERLKRTRI